MKTIKIIALTTMLALSGCFYHEAYHEGDSKEWIEQQVQQGKLTRAQADQLLKQEGK